MIFIYLDEAGISDPKNEPHVVVAGVLIDADRKWKRVEEHLHELADRHAPAPRHHNFVFHATDLFSGKRSFPQADFPKEARWAILDQLVAIPGKYNLPVVFGSVNRVNLAKSYPKETTAKLTNSAQGIAYVIAMYQAEHWMKENAEDGEVAAVVMENNHQARETIASAHDFIQARYSNVLREHGLEKLGVKHIIEAPHFSEKRINSPLQIADACAFGIKRHRMGKPDGFRFRDPLISQLIMRYKSEL